MILVMDDGFPGRHATFAKRYRLFKDVDQRKAIEHAQSIGWEDPFGMSIDWKPGIANKYMSGDANVTIITLEPVE